MTVLVLYVLLAITVYSRPCFRSSVAGGIMDGRTGDVADDHYHRYMVKITETLTPGSCRASMRM